MTSSSSIAAANDSALSRSIPERTPIVKTGIEKGSASSEALVAEAARTNGRVLITRDRRAVRTYEFLGIDLEVI